MLDFWYRVWYNKNVLKGKDKGCEIEAQKGQEKKLKEFQKTLDKKPKV